MALSILPPVAEGPEHAISSRYDAEFDSDESMEDDNDRPSKRVRLSRSSTNQIAVPGEKITDDTQWMR
jgi:hypothetical protein